jgi:hypothetical protein
VAAHGAVRITPLLARDRADIQPIVQDPEVMQWMGQGSGWRDKKVSDTFRCVPPSGSPFVPESSHRSGHRLYLSHLTVRVIVCT